MKKIDVLVLTSWELLQVYGIVAAQRGSLGELRIYWRLQDVLEPTEEEREQLGWMPVDMGYSLDPDSFDVEIEVELSKRDVSTIKVLVQQFRAWPAGREGRQRILDLCEKFGIDAEV